MAYRGSDDVLRRGAALAVAALIAPLATVLLVIILPVGSASESFSLSRDLNFGSVMLMGMFAMLFGFVGSAAFLGVAFWLARRAVKPSSYAWAGLLAGLAYAGIGVLLRLAFHFGESLDGWQNAFRTLGFWGWFALMLALEAAIVPLVFVASGLAGALAGLIFGRLIDRPSGGSRAG